MKNITKYFGFLILTTIYSCSQNNESVGIKMAGEDLAISAIHQETNVNIERKLIKEGHVEFETNDLNTTRRNIFEAVERHNAFVSSDREYKSTGRMGNTVVIRVPAEKFDNLYKDAIQGVERFENKEIFVRDVTEEFIDIQARLKTQKELESRYIELLKQARNVPEILEIEKQIGLLRSEIESIEGRLKYLQNQVSFSTLTMTFYESIPNRTEFAKKFKNGFRIGKENLIWFFVALIYFWPFILIGIGIFIGLKFYRRRNKK